MSYFQNLDASRQADYLELTKRLSDPNTSMAEKSKIDDSLYAIKSQASIKSISKMREDLAIAVKNGDRQRVEKISEQAKKIDRDWQN